MSRFHDGVRYPQIAYGEMGVLFFFGNWIYHKEVYRRNMSKLAFFAYLPLNAFMAYTMVEAFDPNVARWYAAALNNTMEYETRAKMNYLLR